MPHRRYPAIPSITSNGLHDEVAACTACPLHKSCTSPVGPVGPRHAAVMLVAEAPAYWESVHSIPLTGPTWAEMEHYLRLADLSRDTVWLSNSLHCPIKDPTYADTAVCWPTWKPRELEAVNPSILVVMGQLSLQALLSDPKATVAEYHGFPFQYTVGSWTGWVLNTYHPAAGIHAASYLPALREDFLALLDLKRGIVRERPVDPWDGKEVYRRLSKHPPITSNPMGVDTETLPDGSLWCAGFSDSRGSGYIVPPEQARLTTPKPGTKPELVFHNALFDLPLLIRAGHSLPPVIHDTYLMAKLLQEDSLGLKALCRRLLGMEMQDYMEVVGPWQVQLSTAYLQRALEVARTLPVPEPRLIRESLPDGRGIAIKTYKPTPLSRTGKPKRKADPAPDTGKVARLLTDLASGKLDKEGNPPDPVKRWKEWKETGDGQVEAVEAVIGPHPVASLADVPEDDAVWYSARDPDATLRLFHVLKPRLEAAGLWDAYSLDMASFPMVAEMEANGILVDRPRLLRLIAHLETRLAEVEADCWSLAGYPFNPQSSDQVAHLLYRRMGLKPRRYTDGGSEGTQDDDILPYRNDHPIVSSIITYRRLLKLKTTYSEPYERLSRADGRVRCSYGLSQTIRFQGREPNLSAIPAHMGVVPVPEAAELHNCFIPSPGMVFLAFDLGQNEMRVTAHESKDPGMIQCFWDNQDIHTDTSMLMFGVDRETVLSDEDRYRYPAKCFHPDTEVLTKTGWKRIPDLAVGEEVMAADPHDEGAYLMWQTPTQVFTQPNEHGYLVHLKNNGIDLRVTPDHRMLAWQGQKHMTPRVVMPHEMAKQRDWANAGIFLGGHLDPDERLLRLAVATEADGSFSWRRVRFGFYREDKIARLKMLAGEGNYAQTTNSNGKLRPVTAICFSRALSDDVHKMLDADKTFPWWWLDLSQKSRGIVMDELQYWDAHVNYNSRETQLIYGSGLAKSRQVVQALATMSGKKARTKRVDATGECVNISTHWFTRGGHVQITDEPYAGEVACLSVPSSFVLVRDGGIPVITGQSVGFGVIFGLTGSGLFRQMEYQMPGRWSEQECFNFIEKYLDARPGVRQFMADTIARGRRTGEVRDLVGHRLLCPALRSPNQEMRQDEERRVINFPAQAGGASVMKAGMAKVYSELQPLSSSGSLRWLLQEHDAIKCEVEEGLADVVKPWVKGLLEGAMELRVPVKASAKEGRTLGELG